ncbi:putative ribosomal protein [Conidiobolus coronatus NRRL 28638]|jgi:large subunit ribosomal protein L14e|uniref:Putative ribosomal protein n=1 Tax=Conidiobolus coronatus (strain ATCC 28846 / CBS 209.66 / NRRL 28638) TaxID=796925 RepID=A0A137PFQ3_CONC2|nr:putative ribosomal protein [Conidiobolus coronatus NRRL 28638]|eukprot:KXN73805.1 putative ribosomal protein [Conidiobolus coronatus NRRL 28638]
MTVSVFKRVVEVGRAVLINGGEYNNKVAVIVEIIDHNRALIEGPTTGVPRHAHSFKNLRLLPYTLPKLPRGIRSAGLKKAIESAELVSKWEASTWAQKLAKRAKRATLTDFDRFKLMKLRKQRRSILNKEVAALKKQQA